MVCDVALLVNLLILKSEVILQDSHVGWVMDLRATPDSVTLVECEYIRVFCATILEEVSDEL